MDKYICTVDDMGRIMIPQKLRQELEIHTLTQVEVDFLPNGSILLTPIYTSEEEIQRCLKYCRACGIEIPDDMLERK